MRKETGIHVKRYRILTKKQAAVILLLLFTGIVAVIVLAGSLPYAFANVTARANRRLPVCCTDRSDKVVSLTFDAAWGDQDTQTMMDTLAQYDVKASFFVTGEWTQRCQTSVRALHEAGHEVMNLSDTHPHMAALSRDTMKIEIQRCNDKIEAITGVRPTLFRPPHGEYNDTLMETVQEMQMTAVQWDVDSLDWKGISAEEITRRVMNQVQSGSIVRFHNAAQYTPQALPMILEALQQKGFRFLPLSQMLYDTPYAINDEGRQIGNTDPLKAP